MNIIPIIILVVFTVLVTACGPMANDARPEMYIVEQSGLRMTCFRTAQHHPWDCSCPTGLPDNRPKDMPTSGQTVTAAASAEIRRKR